LSVGRRSSLCLSVVVMMAKTGMVASAIPPAVHTGRVRRNKTRIMPTQSANWRASHLLSIQFGSCSCMGRTRTGTITPLCRDQSERLYRGRGRRRVIMLRHVWPGRRSRASQRLREAAQRKTWSGGREATQGVHIAASQRVRGHKWRQFGPAAREQRREEGSRPVGEKRAAQH